MDPNNPQNPNPATASTPPTDPNSLGAPSVASDQVISDVTQTPIGVSAPTQAQAPAFNTTAPETPLQEPPPAAPNPWEQSPSQNPTATSNPWDTVANPAAAAPADPLATPSTPETSATQNPWPSSTAQPAAPQAENPFLQPQANMSFGAPAAAPVQEAGSIPLPPAGAAPTPNPMATTNPDPLNTAFSAAGAPTNPFASASASPTTAPPAAVPEATENAPASPWGQPEQTAPAQAPAANAPTTGFISGSDGPPAPTDQPGTTQPADSTPIQDQALSSPNGTLDLSSLQSNSPTTPADGSNPVAPQTAAGGGTPPAPPPVDNAPTDLSHLIAGDDSANTAQPGNVYTPPVAQDQPSGGMPTPQTPAAESGAAPAGEKHLNLTKVLLVAGIPIILIVAALSAYLILGVGKSAPPADDTSLPVEQTQDTQAPLTNPPQQIAAPSPQTLPELAAPSPSPVESSVLPVSSPAPSSAAGSPTSAMDKLRARQSSAPASSPAASNAALSTPPPSL